MTSSAAHQDHHVAVAPLGPDSLTWRLGLPRTILLLAGRALLMQVSHPTIGAGVRDHSAYATDPWGRLDRTVTSLELQLFGGERAVAEGLRLKEMHKPIKGTGFDGKHYSAFEPAAMAWVPITNFESLIKLKETFGKPLTLDQKRTCWAEQRRAAIVIGVNERYLPETLEGALALFADTVENVLDDNETCQTLIETLSLKDVPPPTDWLPAPIWRALKPFGRQILGEATVGTLPPQLSERLGVPPSGVDSAKLNAMATAVRTASPLVPDRLLHYPLAFEAMEASRAHRKSIR